MSPPKRTTEKDSPAASEEAGLVPTPATETPPPPNKKSEADRLIRQYIGWSCAGGLVPVPLLDIAAITAAQIQLVRELSALYGVRVRFNSGLARRRAMIETIRISAANPAAPINVERSVSWWTGTRISSAEMLRTTFQPVNGEVAQ